MNDADQISAPAEETAASEAPPRGTAQHVRVRYFAAARAATGRDEEDFELPDDSTLAELTAILRSRHRDLAEVLPVCSYLLNGRSVDADRAADPLRTPALHGADLIDVLPPFAGG